MSQTATADRHSVCIKHESSQLVYEVIATLYELDAIGDSSGVTVERIQSEPGIPASKVAGLLEELYEDGIVERVKLSSRHAADDAGRCSSWRKKWDRKPRYRLR